MLCSLRERELFTLVESENGGQSGPLSARDFLTMLTSRDGVLLDRCFLLGKPERELFAYWHPKDAVVTCVIEEDRLFDQCVAFLRESGLKVFRDQNEVYTEAAAQRWPGWEQHSATK